MGKLQNVMTQKRRNTSTSILVSVVEYIHKKNAGEAAFQEFVCLKCLTAWLPLSSNTSPALGSSCLRFSLGSRELAPVKNTGLRFNDGAGSHDIRSVSSVA